MPEWLTSAGTEGSLAPGVLAGRLLLALAGGVAVALIYLASHGRDARERMTLATTIVLLAVLIAMVTMVIGNSVARAFSLVGALSIVRFRTVVDDTRDTAFVIFSVVVGMAAGAGLLVVPLVGIPVVGLAAYAMSHWGRVERASGAARGTLVVRLGLGLDADHVLGTALDRYFKRSRLISTETARQGAAIELTYWVALRAGVSPAALIQQLNQVEGVMGVELKNA